MPTFVLFIGGFQAQPGHVTQWTASAKSLAQRTDWTFDGYPWPPSANKADAKSGTTAFGRNLDEAVKKIEDGKYDQAFIIGHSSGCAIANLIDETLKANGKFDMDKVTLVALDGFAPNPGQLGRKTTQVWSAENGKHKSLNYWNLNGVKKWKAYPANKDCTNIWSLHFQLVNTTSSDKTLQTNKDLGNGYLNCRANMCWLPATP